MYVTIYNTEVTIITNLKWPSLENRPIDRVGIEMAESKGNRTRQNNTNSTVSNTLIVNNLLIGNSKLNLNPNTEE